MSSKTGGLAATTATALVSVGYAALLRANVWPAPEIPSASQVRVWVAQPLTEGFIVFLAQASAGILAVYLVTAVIARLTARLTRAARWLPALHLPGPLQGVAAALLGATAITATATATPAAAATDTAADTVGQPTGHGASATPEDVPHAQPSPAAEDSTTPSPTYTVRRGDTLSTIAARRLGDDRRWPDIYDLNRGAHFPRVGGTLRDPNVIYPGWTLDLPADALRAPHRTGPPPPPRQPETRAPQPAPTTAPPASPTPTTGGPVPSASAAPGTPAPVTSTCTGDGAGHAQDHGPDTAPAWRGITLPSGSWVDLSLALAIAAAVALVWAHRQHRYVPRTPTTAPRLNDPGLAPMPRVVGQIRRGLRRAAASRPDPYQPATPGDVEHDKDQRGLDNENQPQPGNDMSGSGTPHAEVQDADSGRGIRVATGDADISGPLPMVPAWDNPLSALWPRAGLGLTGSGAEAAARGFLTATLASGGVEHPEARTQVVIPSVTAARLLGAAAVTLPRTPRLTVAADLDEALDILEAHTLHRTRLACQHEVDTVAELRRADPYEGPVPPVMLIADTMSRHERARVAALLAQGQRLDIHGVLLGDWPDGDTVTVAADGATTRANGGGARHGSHPADVGRLAVLDPAETLGLLITLAESHTGQPQAPAPTDPTRRAPAEAAGSLPPDDTAARPPLPAIPTNRGAPDVTAEADSEAEDPRGSSTAPADDVGSTPAVAAPTPDTAQRHRPGEAAAAGGEAEAADQKADAQDRKPEPRPVLVRVLGTPGVVDGDPQRTPRAKSLELLVYLAVHNGTASTEAILDDLLPDAPTSKAAGRLYTYVSGLRAVLRHNGGPGSYVTHPDHRYLLNLDLLDVDLWRMRAAIRDAAQATDPQARTDALRRAVDAYTGPLADGCDYEWVEPYREAIRQEALDAHLALADTLTGQPAQQLRVLDTAIAHHPHHEPLYQAAMRARAQLGDINGIRTLRRTLTRRLAEIDAEPSDDTLTLADRLVADLPQPRSRGRTPSDDGSAA